MDPNASREPARSFPQTRTASPAETKFGTHHAWAFDVPPWADFFNTPLRTSQMPGLPCTAIADEYWKVALEVGYNAWR